MAAEAGNIPRERVIEVRDVVKTYRLGDIEVHALRGVSLDIERGELVAIMGASGSGKSTLMNILGCLDQPTSGQYVLDGIDTAELDEPALAQIRSLRIGFVFQSFNLLARTSAAENVALPLFYSGRIGDSAERVHQALVSLGLGDREQSHPSQLSGGQQQRVAIARALINGPAILLADEPTGNLDSQTAVEIMTTLRDLNRREGLTVILVTHEPDMAAFCDRIVTMRDGLIVSDERRAAAFVADEHRAAAVHGPSPRLPARGGALTAAPAGGEPEADNAAPQGLRGDLSFVRMALLAAGRALARNKLRSALTMLGIFIGVAALITMVAVGQGANEAVKEQIESLGTNLVMIVPGSRTSRGVRSGFGGASTLTVADAQAIQQGDPAVARVGYEIGGNAQVQAGNQNWSTSVQGVSPSYTDIRNWPIVAGRALTAEDESTANRVCLLGQTVVKNLFGPYQNPVGATIFVKNVAVEVVGVLASRGQTGFGRDQDDIILVPFSTAERKILGVSSPSQPPASTSTTSSGSTSNSGGAQTLAELYPTRPNPFGVQPRLTGYVNVIYVQAGSLDAVPSAIDEVTSTLRQRHHLQPGDDDDFSARNISDITQAAQSSSRVMALLLITVASISLLVGGIGIMNILLVSVTERTREIGIRMAIGARRAQVLVQFLVEAVLLSLIGGGLGVLVGIALAKVMSAVAGWPTLLSPAAMLGGFCFSAAVGVFFGYYPARRAARLNPIEALRFE